MFSQRTTNIAFGLAVIIGAVYFIREALAFEELRLPGAAGLNSNVFPITVLVFIIVCSIIVVVQYLTKAGAGLHAEYKVYATKREVFNAVAILITVVVAYRAWPHTGFLPIAIVVGPVCALFVGERRPGVYVSVVVTGAAIYFCFTRLLGVQLG